MSDIEIGIMSGLVFSLGHMALRWAYRRFPRRGVSDKEMKAMLRCHGHELDDEEHEIVARHLAERK